MHAERPARPARIGVVVPVYRMERFVVAALESVRTQTYTDWECVVVDDGSPDDSAQVAATVVDTDPRMRLVRQDNRGVSAARNLGLTQLSPSVELVAFLDPDDVWCPEALERLAARLDSSAESVGAHGYAEYIDEQGKAFDAGLHPSRQRDRRRVEGRRLSGVPAAEPLVFDEAVVISPLYPPATAVFRRAVVEQVGGFDESLRQMEDWDLYLRMLRHGDIVVLQEQVAWYRLHPGQATQRNAEALLSHDLVRRNAWSSPENTTAQRQATVRSWRQLQARRTFRALEQLLRAVRAGEWSRVVPLLAGVVVVAAQNLRLGPPRPSVRALRWTQRRHT